MAPNQPKETTLMTGSIPSGTAASHLRALAQGLAGHGFTVEQTDDGDYQVASRTAPYLSVMVDCRPRASDGGALWFTADGQPLAQADYIHDAIVAIKGRTAGPSDLLRDPGLDQLRSVDESGRRGEIHASEAGAFVPTRQRS